MNVNDVVNIVIIDRCMLGISMCGYYVSFVDDNVKEVKGLIPLRFANKECIIGYQSKARILRISSDQHFVDLSLV